ncbi:MAG: hypothetical protein Q7W55_02205 [Pseudohongiella sp.]|nr:hypothetical protein [Pseudohongiella sp.]
MQNASFPTLHSHIRVMAIVSAYLILSPPAAQAQTPYGWISNTHTSAYTLAPGEMEITSRHARVNDTLDIADSRQKFLASTTRLGGKSGEYKSNELNLRIGLVNGLDVFYQQGEQLLTLEINPAAQLNLVDIEDKLRTNTTRYGLRWVVREPTIKNPQQVWHSLAAELTGVQNKSKDFDGSIESVQLSSTLNIRFDPPQSFALDRLRDDGWQAKIIYGMSLNQNTAINGWVTYAEMESSSGTSSQIDLEIIAQAFSQSFQSKEKHAGFGFNLNWQRIPRMPVQIGYEFVQLFERKQSNLTSDSSLLPSFLRGNNLGQNVNNNHMAWLNVSWWATPNVYVSVGGKLFKNQFTGVIPHYLNPLSGRFAGTTYGYAEAKLGFRFNPSTAFRN